MGDALIRGRSVVDGTGRAAYAADVWFRVQSRDFRVEFEGAFLYARIAQPSLVPGLLYRDAITATQLGAALQTDFLMPEVFSFGIDANLDANRRCAGCTESCGPVAGRK